MKKALNRGKKCRREHSENEDGKKNSVNSNENEGPATPKKALNRSKKCRREHFENEDKQIMEFSLIWDALWVVFEPTERRSKASQNE